MTKQEESKSDILVTSFRMSYKKLSQECIANFNKELLTHGYSVKNPNLLHPGSLNILSNTPKKNTFSGKDELVQLCSIHVDFQDPYERLWLNLKKSWELIKPPEPWSPISSNYKKGDSTYKTKELKDFTDEDHDKIILYISKYLNDTKYLDKFYITSYFQSDIDVSNTTDQNYVREYNKFYEMYVSWLSKVYKKYLNNLEKEIRISFSNLTVKERGMISSSSTGIL